MANITTKFKKTSKIVRILQNVGKIRIEKEGSSTIEQPSARARKLDSSNRHKTNASDTRRIIKKSQKDS